jgi:hypothetical protein
MCRHHQRLLSKIFIVSLTVGLTKQKIKPKLILAQCEKKKKKQGGNNPYALVFQDF